MNGDDRVMYIVEQFHFIRPAWLLMIPVVVLLWWLGRRWRDPLGGWRGAMDRELLAALTVGQTSANHWLSLSLLAAWLLASVSLAGPTWHLEPSPFADDPIPLMLLLRADTSMDGDDLSPSRMERAQLKVADIAELRKGQPLGLIAYAGSAHLVLPPTRDTSLVATMAAEISSTIMPKPGDKIVEAFQLAQRTLASTGGSVIVMADSIEQANIGELEKFGRTSQLDVQFLTVAPANTPESESVVAAAKATGGRVNMLTPDDDDVRALVRRAANAPRSVVSAEKGALWAEAGWWLLAPLSVLSLIGFRRTRTKVESSPGELFDDNQGASSASVAYSSLLAVGVLTWSSLWFSPDQQGQRLMRSDNFQQAAETFADPMRQGIAWFRAGEFKKADQSFARLITADALYNRGNARIMLGQYDDAIKSFDQALKKRPDFADAKTNREIAIARAKLTKSEGGDMGDQKLGADEIRFDKQKSGGQETIVEKQQAVSDATMQSLWLRRVQTKPAEFLKAKFAYQLATHEEQLEASQ